MRWQNGLHSTCQITPPAVKLQQTCDLAQSNWLLSFLPCGPHTYTSMGKIAQQPTIEVWWGWWAKENFKERSQQIAPCSPLSTLFILRPSAASSATAQEEPRNFWLKGEWRSRGEWCIPLSRDMNLLFLKYPSHGRIKSVVWSRFTDFFPGTNSPTCPFPAPCPPKKFWAKLKTLDHWQLDLLVTAKNFTEEGAADRANLSQSEFREGPCKHTRERNNFHATIWKQARCENADPA